MFFNFRSRKKENDSCRKACRVIFRHSEIMEERIVEQIKKQMNPIKIVDFYLKV
jgi:hypothetical protein